MNPKDLTSTNENKYAYMRKMFIKNVPKEKKEVQYIDSSSYIHNKKMISIGRQKEATFYTKNNKREILQSLRRLRSRS
jgi:hypothetical protein